MNKLNTTKILTGKAMYAAMERSIRKPYQKVLKPVVNESCFVEAE